MKCRALLIGMTCLLAQASMVQAGNAQTPWQAVAAPQSAHVHFYVDRSSIRQTGKFTRARVLYDFNEPQLNEDFGTYSKSYVVDSYIDCNRQRLAPERMTLYSESKGLGKRQGQTAAAKENQWAAAGPGTINGAIVEAACRQVQRK